MTAVVIGIGNPYRHDDAAGLAVVDRARAVAPAHVRFVESDGEPSRLLDAWDGAELAVVVDAVRDGDRHPGTVHRSDTLTTAVSTPVTSHAIGMEDAWALASVLGRRPARLVVYAIVGERFDLGEGLSPGVAVAVDEVASRVLQDVRPR